MAKSRIWTEEKQEIAIRLWQTNLTTHVIAERLGVTYASLQLYAHRNRHKLPKRGAPKVDKPKVAQRVVRNQYKRYTDTSEIAKASKLWQSQKSIYEIHTTLKMSGKTFIKMRKYAPNRFPKRDSNKKIQTYRPQNANTKAKLAKVGEGFYLKHAISNQWLHCSGKALTLQKAYRYRATWLQCIKMLENTSYDLIIIPENKHM